MYLATLKFSRAIITAFLLGTLSSFGQQRMIDHEALCITPVGEVINGGTLPLHFGMINHGPDPRYAKDTIVYRLFSLFPNGERGRREAFQGPLRGTGNAVLPIGGRFMYGDSGRYVIKFDYPNITEPLVIDFCLEISTFYLNESGDTVQYVSHYDPNPSNDRCCKTVTVLPKSSSIAQDMRQNEEGVWVYPNPVKDRLYIRTSAGFGEKGLQLAIYDISGRLLREQMYSDGTTGDDTWSADVGDMAAGIYHVYMRSSKGMVSRKIVISR